MFNVSGNCPHVELFPERHGYLFETYLEAVDDQSIRYIYVVLLCPVIS